MTIDEELVEEWAGMLEAIAQEMRTAVGHLGPSTVVSMEDYTKGKKARPVNMQPPPKEIRSTFYHHEGADQGALLRAARRTLQGDPVHGDARSPICIIRIYGDKRPAEEYVVSTVEELDDIFS